MLKENVNMKYPMYLQIEDGSVNSDDWNVSGNNDETVCQIYCIDPFRSDNILVVGIGDDDIQSIRKLNLDFNEVESVLKSSFRKFVATASEIDENGYNLGDLLAFYGVLNENFDALMASHTSINKHLIIQFYDDTDSSKRFFSFHPIVSEPEILSSEDLIAVSNSVLLPRDKQEFSAFFKTSKVVSIFR